jgi:hypothetical protein
MTMKSTLMKMALLGTVALGLGAIAPAASAKTIRLAFTGYCDGVTLKSTDNQSYGGHRTGCATDQAGGLAVKVKFNPTPYVDYATSDNGVGTFTFFLNIPTKTWYLYETTGGVFTETNSGAFTYGLPAALPPGASKSSTSVRKTGLPSPF